MLKEFYLKSRKDLKRLQFNLKELLNEEINLAVRI